MSLLAGRWSNENQRETERERDLQAGVKHVNSVNKNKPPISRRNLAGRTDKAEQKSGHLSMVGMLTSSWPQSIHISLFWLNTVVMQIHYQSTILFSHNSDGYYTKGLGILKLEKWATFWNYLETCLLAGTLQSTWSETIPFWGFWGEKTFNYFCFIIHRNTTSKGLEICYKLYFVLILMVEYYMYYESFPRV